ncbi:MBL fold metallo-hydrolase [Paenibacillus sp. BSR1-1]|uniref:MBL fold metallo-hydrolase n=1 Tax=Paenibacillus sp. BSR1-1 TaxID=3020845 RepID=UPI0025B0E4F5|nr:MBL fold metallo-hydrolase [Paenibacillus sp. BSR1-1]MDN3016164.1 MBL fold metallo-hydrolase [Paenibacillus sp. BSR1-1]
MNDYRTKPIGDFITKLADGIWQIELPHLKTQSANVFLIEDEKITLIDSGPPDPFCMDILLKALRRIGYQWTDINLLLLTHPHIDHLGGVAFLPTLPEIYAFKGTQTEMRTYDHYMKRWRGLLDKFASEYPELQGILLSKLSIDWLHSFFPVGGTLEITKEVIDGETISLGKRELQVIYTPGHSMHHMSLLLKQEKLFFSGDFMLHRGPALAHVMGDQVEAFIQSIKRVEDLTIEKVYPSHGYPFSFESGLGRVSSLISRQEERLLNALSDSPKTAMDLYISYIGSKNASIERFGLDFAGADTIIKHLLNKGDIKKEGLYFYRNGFYH